MKALILEKPFSFQLAEKELVEDLKPDEALIKIRQIITLLGASNRFSVIPAF
jgi:hypothetical protein